MSTAAATRLRNALAGAEPLLRAISETDSALHPAPGKWSPRQIIGHLIDSASNNHQRFVRAVWQDDLVFPGYEQERWVELQRYQETAWSELLTLWGSLNRHITTVMDAVPHDVRMRVHTKHNLDETASRAPTTEAEQTLDYFMGDYVDHLELHLRQILGDGVSLAP
ncbi:MAG: DinB family protein [Gemmatimonadetes bacterium]|nr:DinB family protein [Gemmatimonadota bacterium]